MDLYGILDVIPPHPECHQHEFSTNVFTCSQGKWWPLTPLGPFCALLLKLLWKILFRIRMATRSSAQLLWSGCASTARHLTSPLVLFPLIRFLHPYVCWLLFVPNKTITDDDSAWEEFNRWGWGAWYLWHIWLWIIRVVRVSKPFHR